MARRLMDDNKVQSRKMTVAAWEAYSQGLIDDDVYKRIVVSERNLR